MGILEETNDNIELENVEENVEEAIALEEEDQSRQENEDTK